jgi:uncharacterized protein (TIGR03089 family)
MALDPHRPRLIWHGNGRTELSTATLANWSAKTAGLLVDELGTRPGQVAQWSTRRSWQSVPLLLGAWWAGLVVTDIDDVGETEAIVGFIDEDDGSELEWGSAAEYAYVASTHPFGLGSGELPDYHQHVAEAVLPQADRFSPRRPGATADSVAMITTDGSISVGDVLDRSRAAGAALGTGGRILSVLDLTLPDDVCVSLLGALAADGSLIQVVGIADPARLAAIANEERATATLGVDLPGLPQLGLPRLG